MREEDISNRHLKVPSAGLILIIQPGGKLLMEYGVGKHKYAGRAAAAVLMLMCVLLLSSCMSKEARLIKQLGSEDEADRVKAVQSLTEMGREVVKPLIEALKDENTQKQRGAASVLGEIGDIAAVEPLMALLQNPNTAHDVQSSVVGALGKLKDGRAVPQLVETLGKGDPNLVTPLIDALVSIGKPSVKPLADQLDGKDTWLVMNAEIAIEQLGETAVPDLTAIVNDTAASKGKRIKVINILKKLKGEGIFEAFSGALTDKEREIRSAALEAVISMNDPRGTDALISALKDSDDIIRERAVIALGNTNDQKAVEPLIGMLKDKKDSVWKASVSSLVNLGDAGTKRLIASLGAENIGLLYNNHGYFIDKGIPGSEAVLIKALNKYDSKDLAVDLLNCGNSELDKAARTWAPKHGYRVVTGGTGGGGPVWGSQK